MTNIINRREFLKLSSMGFGSLAINPLRRMLPPEDQIPPLGIGRVTVSSIGVYKEPNLKSDKVTFRTRDELVTLAQDLISPYGPDINPHWYKVVGGYSHSAYLQRVEDASLAIASWGRYVCHTQIVCGAQSPWITGNRFTGSITNLCTGLQA